MVRWDVLGWVGRWLAMAWLVSLGGFACQQRAEPAAGKPPKASPAPMAPAADAPNAASASKQDPVAPPPESVAVHDLVVDLSPAGDGMRLSVQNHGQLTVLSSRAALTPIDGTPQAQAGVADLSGACGTAAEACRPLAAGAEWLFSPLQVVTPDGACRPVAPGDYRIAIQGCPPETARTHPQPAPPRAQH